MFPTTLSVESEAINLMIVCSSRIMDILISHNHKILLIDYILAYTTNLLANTM